MGTQLDVFLSSSVTEFRSERKYLSKKISKIPFLECRLLENKGPQTQNTTEYSLNEIEKCDILVGILGDCDSKITRAEIKKAYETGKYCLIYKKSETSSEEIKKFIKEFVMLELVYHEFRKKNDLYTKIVAHLEDHIYKILTRGLECFKEDRQKILKSDREIIVETTRKIEEEEYGADDVLREAERSLSTNNYLSSAIMSWMALELALKYSLVKIGQLPHHVVERRSTIELVNIAHDKKIIDQRDYRNILKIRMMRNQAIHNARMPSQQDTKTALSWAHKLLKKIS